MSLKDLAITRNGFKNNSCNKRRWMFIVDKNRCFFYFIAEIKQIKFNFTDRNRENNFTAEIK